jgi:N-dimethylarginine dimethylaminohydrolase
MNVEVGSEPTVALGQWEALVGTLRGLGARIELVEPRPGLPDLVFTANAGLIWHDTVYPSRFRYGVRQGESPIFEAWFRSHGYTLMPLPAGMYFEGAGDALFCGETLFGGYRFRSDAKSLLWLGSQMGVPVLPLELVDPRFYHLDTCFCPLDHETALYYPGAFDDYGRSVLKERIGRLIEVGASEAVTFSCNAVVVGRTVVLNEDTPELTGRLREAGFDTRAVRLTEFIKSGGSAKCLTLRLDGEEAAAWAHPPGAGA